MAPHHDGADTKLALRTSQGDRDAFAELYDRHFRSVYDLVYRMVRDQDLAADISQNTFIRAWENLQKRTVSGNVRAWLLTIARNTAINEIERKKRWRNIVASESDAGTTQAFEVIDTSRLSNPEAVIDDQELVDLVWTSAAALGPKDYSLLDLHLRKDLSAGEMAENLGLPSARVHVMLSRLRDSLEESVSLALLIRRGRRECAVLSEVLEGATRDFTRDTRLEVRRHLKECDFCAESSKRFVAPAEIFSGLALIPVSHPMSADVWLRVASSIAPTAGVLAILAAVRDQASSWWTHAGLGGKAVAFTAVGVLVAVPMGVAILASDGGGSDTAAARGVTSSSGDQTRSLSTNKKSPRPSALQDAPATQTPDPAVAGAVASPEPEGAADSPLTAGATAAPGVPAVSTSAPVVNPHAPAPTVTPTPAPTEPTPLPTEPPPPLSGADVAVIGVTLIPGTAAPAGQQFYLSVTAFLRNLGDATSAVVDTTFNLGAPAGCSASSATTVTVQDKTLPLGADVSITRTWNVTCASAGDHSFAADASVALDASQALTDPNAGNNATSGAIAVAVLP